MSDRIVVFDRGRIQQVGTPAEVYEGPATEFVAGFVGTSNLLRGSAAFAVLQRDGLFSIRPEKIRVLDEDGELPAGWHGATGTVREVVYAGAGTRFVVDLDVGASLVALQQNVETASVDVMAVRGRRVRLGWRREHEFAVRGPGVSEPGVQERGRAPDGGPERKMPNAQEESTSA